MNLLPAKTSDFASREYWDDFFAKRTEAFEWYGELGDFAGGLRQRRSEQEDAAAPTAALVLGCGNSRLSADLAEARFAARVTSLDFSQRVIDDMRAKHRGDARLEWVVGDFLALPTEWTAKFDWVVDKGALDALLTDASQADKGAAMLAEAARALGPGNATLAVVSLLQDHVLACLLDAFAHPSGAPYRVDLLAFYPNSPTKLLPFLVTVTRAPASKITVRPSKDQPMSAAKTLTPSQAQRAVRDAQETYAAKLRLRDAAVAGEGVRATFSAGPDERFTLVVVDARPKTVAIPFGALIVPQGAENQAAFGKPKGQVRLARSNGIARLVFVHLARGHDFSRSSPEDVQRQVSGALLELRPVALPRSYKIPFLAVAQDLGSRVVVARGESPLSGEFSVEDVGNTRRLVFMSSPLDVQSECVLLAGGGGKPDLDQLAFELHRAMVSAFAMLPAASVGVVAPAEEKAGIDDGSRAVVVGLGGGGLAAYVARKRLVARVEAVELDPAVVDVARRWFALPDAVAVHVGDGLEYLLRRDAAEPRSARAVFVDVDAKSSDANEPLGFPPPAFVSKATLEHVRDAVLAPTGGFLAVNTSCDDSDARREMLARFRAVFPRVVVFDASDGDAAEEGDVVGVGNLVVVAFNVDNAASCGVSAVEPPELRELFGVVHVTGQVEWAADDAAKPVAAGTKSGTGDEITEKTTTTTTTTTTTVKKKKKNKKR